MLELKCVWKLWLLEIQWLSRKKVLLINTCNGIVGEAIELLIKRKTHHRQPYNSLNGAKVALCCNEFDPKEPNWQVTNRRNWQYFPIFATTLAIHKLGPGLFCE